MVDLNIGQSLSGIYSFLADIGRALPYIMIFVAMVAIGLWWYFDKQYNKKVVLFKIVGDGFRLITDRAKLIKDANGVPFWRIKNLKVKVDVPNDNCMIASKGGETAFGYITSTGQITWCAPEYHPDKLMRKIHEQGEASLNSEEVKHYEFLRTFRPITTTQRASLAYQIEQAKLEVKVNWQQHLPLIISGVVLLLVLVVFMMFFGKVMEPIIAAADVVNSGKNVDLKIVETLERIEQRMQVLDGNVPENQGTNVNINTPR